jgi:hypothetical protein
MGIRKVSFGLVAAALVGTSPVVAAVPSASQLSLAPVSGDMGGARLGASHGGKSHVMSSASIVIGVLAVAAVGGGVYFATKHHHHHSASN